MTKNIKVLDHLSKGLIFLFVAAIIFAMKHDPEHTVSFFSADFIQPVLNYFKGTSLLWNSIMVVFFVICAGLKFSMSFIEYRLNKRVA